MPSLWELFVKISGDSSNYKQSVKEAREATEGFAAIAEAAGARIATSLSLAGAAAFAVASADKFEAATFTIQRATGAAGEKLAGLEESLKSLYTGTAQSADAVGATLAQLSIRTGLAGDALESLASSTLKFSKVTGADLQTTVQQNEKLFAQWSISTADQAGAMDMLYVASQKSGKSVTDISSSLLTLGPTLRAFGYSFSDAVALVASFDRAGLDATDVARGLNAMFAKMAQEGKNPREELARLIENLKNTGSAAQAAAELIDTGFSKRAVVGMQDAVRRGALNIDDLRAALDKSQGAVSSMAEKTTTFGESWSRLLHTLEVVGAPPGKVLLDFLSHAVEGLTVEVKGLIELFGALASGNWEPKQATTLEDFDRQMAQTYGPKYWERTDPSGKVAASMRQSFIGQHPAGPDTLRATFGPSADQAGFLTDQQISKDFSTLGLEDYKTELQAITAAFNELQKAGKLSADQIQEVQGKIEDLKHYISGDLDKWNNGIIGPPKEFQQIPSLIDALTPKLTSAQGEIKAYYDAINGYATSSTHLWAVQDEALTGLPHEITEVQLAMQKLANDAPRQFFGKEGYAALDDTTKKLDEMGQFIAKVDPKQLRETEKTLEDMGIFAPALTGEFRQINEAMKDLGISGARENVAKLTADFNTLGDALQKNIITGDEYRRALINYVQDAQRMGVELDANTVRIYEQAKAQVESSNNILKFNETMQSATKSGFDSVERGFADMVTSANYSFDNMAKIGQRFASDLYTILLKSLFKPLEDQIARLMGQLGSMLGGIWGNAQTAATGAANVAGGTAAGAAGAAAQGGAGAAAGSVGAATSSLAGWVNAGISALSGIVSGIQQAHANNLLGEIEINTRSAFNEIFNLRRDQWDQYNGIFDRLGEVWRDMNKGFAASGHGSGNTFNFYNVDIDGIIRQLKAAGAI